ncbi:unnamed protein product [Didymodactylos carnosus]|uniref:Uncharacterized protein n=1 Tax=Didymodactylos carnosus TaxID=1234261 RepID=A0A814VFV5_9BILA|nr:unnamed protein product [Didymodactylos carnosus]CAF3951938.1 unnamed protein product [Didymodactylos carnosus]
MISCLIRPLVKDNPTETLKYFLPKTCESIEKILNNSESTVILNDEKGDMELIWYLILFAELVGARDDTLLIYKQMIMFVFHECIHIINKNSYEAIANAAKYLLESFSHTYPIDYRLTVENIDESFMKSLPIRAWRQYVDFDKLQVQFHIPNVDEINFACEFVDTFIYPELILLNEKGQNIRSLTIQKMAHQIKKLELNNFETFCDIDKQVEHKLFELPIDQYSEVRCKAQCELFCMLNHYEYSFQVIVDRIVKLLNTLGEGNHDQIKGLFRNFGLAFLDNFMEQLYVLIGENIKDKEKGSHRLTAEIVAGMIRGSKYWTLDMLDELWKKLEPFLMEENIDPRRMYRLIEFIRTLINNETMLNTFNGISRWSLIENLTYFQWRIPSILGQINEHAKVFLDHSSKVCYRNANQFLGSICDQLHQAIEILILSNPFVEIDFEARKALNFIETAKAHFSGPVSEYTLLINV